MCATGCRIGMRMFSSFAYDCGAWVHRLIQTLFLGLFQVKMFFLCGIVWTADAMEIMMVRVCYFFCIHLPFPCGIVDRHEKRRRERTYA